MGTPSRCAHFFDSDVQRLTMFSVSDVYAFWRNLNLQFVIIFFRSMAMIMLLLTSVLIDIWQLSVNITLPTQICRR